jgi:hypothetical protein
MDELLSHPQGDGDSSVYIPLVKKHRVDMGDGVFDDNDEVSKIPDLPNRKSEKEEEDAEEVQKRK